MKLVIAVIQNNSVQLFDKLLKERYKIAKFESAGGFFIAGNTTFLIEINDERVNEVCQVVKEYSGVKERLISAVPILGLAAFSSYPIEIQEGGTLIYVVPIE